MEGDTQKLKEIGSFTGLNRDPKNSIYFALRDQELDQLDIRNIHNSRGDELSSSHGQRSVKPEKNDKSKDTL
jgi:hypothetical protein